MSKPRWEVGTPSCDVSELKQSSVLLTITQGVWQVVASFGVLKESSEPPVLWSEVHDCSVLHDRTFQRKL